MHDTATSTNQLFLAHYTSLITGHMKNQNTKTAFFSMYKTMSKLLDEHIKGATFFVAPVMYDNLTYQ